MLHGMNIVVVRPTPRMVLSANVPVTEAFRAEINLWMAGFFGFEDMLQGAAMVYTDPITQRKTIYCSPEAAAELRKACQS